MADAVLTAPVEDREAAIASRRRLVSRLIIYGLLGVFSIVYIVPLLVVITNAFRSNAEISANGLIANDVALQGMELFAREVLPHLEGQLPSSSTSDNAAYEPAFQGDFS